MSAASGNPSKSPLHHLAIHGSSSGRVKLLGGFQKKVHREPDSVNPATQAFLARICEAELAEEAERIFQETRTALGYKRREISLSVNSPSALLTTKDFDFEVCYSLSEDDPAEYTISRTMLRIQSGELLQTDEFNGVFAGMFSSLVFPLERQVPVEDVIDAVEGLDDADGGPADTAIQVDYPSDCRDCVLSVDGVPARVVYNGAVLEMCFDQQGSPRDLLVAFENVRHAFAMSGDEALLALIRPAG